MKYTIFSFLGILGFVAVFAFPSVASADIPMITLSASSVFVAPNTASTLTWSATGVTSCTAYGSWSGPKALSGSQSTGNLTLNKSYVLTCTGVDGSVSKFINVKVNNVLNQSVFVSANPIFIPPNTASTLSWSTTNSTSCTAYGSWSGPKALSGSQSTGNLTDSQYYILTCTGNSGTLSDGRDVFVSNGYSLLVTNFVGSEIVITAPGINCGVDCIRYYSPNTSVVIAAVSSTYDTASWNGACAGQGNPCVLLMDGNKSVSIGYIDPWGFINGDWDPLGYHFKCCYIPPIEYTLTTSIGSGSGDILSSPPGDITCPGDCTESYPSGASISITAAPRAGYNFSSWTGGACAGQPSTCLLTMSGNRTEIANFIPAPLFDYSLTNSGASSVTKTAGDAYVTNTITKTLTSGTAGPVTLSVSSSLPSGVTASISNQGSNPTSNSTITFTVSNTASADTYQVTITGSPLNKTTTFNLVITQPPGISVSCSASPAVALLGQSITWTATVSGGTPPYTYSWAGTDIPTTPAPSTNPYVKSYGTIGQKTAAVTVTDSGSFQATCSPAAVAQISFDPSFKEF